MKPIHSFGIFILLGTAWIFSVAARENSRFTPIDLPYVVLQPAPTCTETNFRELVKEAESCEDLDSPYILVRPTEMVVDSRGNLLVYDDFQDMIIRFNPQLQACGAIGRKGQGPGDFSGTKIGSPGLYLTPAEHLLVSERALGKVMEFGPNGKLLGEKHHPALKNIQSDPVVDRLGRIYIAQGQGHLFGIFAYNDGRRIGNAIADSEMNKILGYKPKLPRIGSFYNPSHSTDYTTVEQDKFVVFLRRSGILYIWRNDRLLRQIPLWPRQGLQLYMQEARNVPPGSMLAFGTVFFDRDDERFLYLQLSTKTPDGRIWVYRFDLNGTLHAVLWFKPPESRWVSFRYKRHQAFYALMKDEEENPVLMRFREKSAAPAAGASQPMHKGGKK